MKRSKKAGGLSLWVYFFVSSAFAFYEYTATDNMDELLLISRAVLLVWLLGLCFWISQQPYRLVPHFFMVDRTYRESLVRRFGIVGIQTTGVIHDLKNMLAAPRMNLDLLKKKLVNDGEEVHDLIEALEGELSYINCSVTSLNQVVALQDQEKEYVDVRTLLTEVADVLNLSGRGVSFEIFGNATIYSEKALPKSILFNIMMNSIQAFRRNQISDPKIRVVCDSKAVTISDNGGGFPTEILEALKKVKFRSFDETGIGLFLVWNGVQSCGGDVVFSNTAEGAQVRIVFPDKAQSRRGFTWPSFLKLP